MENQNEPNRPATPAEPAADGLREISRRLYELADDLGGGHASQEAESIARAVSRCVDDSEKLAKVEAALDGFTQEDCEWTSATVSDFVEQLRGILSKGGLR